MPVSSDILAQMSCGWRLVPFEVGEPHALLASGLQLLDDLGADPRPVLRWYRAASPALVLGRGQAIPTAAGLPVVTRGSGGGAVLMDTGLLSLDVLVPASHPLAGGELGAIFDRVGDAWAAGLRDVGVADLSVHRGAGGARRRGSPREQLLAAVCYATIGRGEVLAGGRKLVGLAQRRRRAGVLVQCGLLRRWEPSRLLAVMGGDPDDPDIAAAAIGLDDLLAPPPADEAVMAAVNAQLTGLTM